MEKTLKQVIEYFHLEWKEYTDIGDDLLLYIWEDGENYCSFVIVEMVSFWVSEMRDWESVDLPFDMNNAAVFIWGKMYFDGIRHLYFWEEFTNNYGYFHYADIEKISLALSEIKKLEKKYCTM